MRMKPLSEILEEKVDPKYYASETIRRSRLKRVKNPTVPSIWHENKAGHVSAYPFSCALRAGASYNYLLVNGERRPTPRELLRLQGFPETFIHPGKDSQVRKQTGNSVPVPVVEAVLTNVLGAIGWIESFEPSVSEGQTSQERSFALRV
jgi:DNA (cytosine-5)-methyltransferase 1